MEHAAVGLDSTIKSCKTPRKFATEYVDLYLIHAPFAFSASIEAGLEQWKALLSLKEQGLCKNVGWLTSTLTT